MPEWTCVSVLILDSLIHHIALQAKGEDRSYTDLQLEFFQRQIPWFEVRVYHDDLRARGPRGAWINIFIPPGSRATPSAPHHTTK